MWASKQWKSILSNHPIWGCLGTLLGFMSLQRFLFHWNFPETFLLVPRAEIVAAHFTGIRFDLLVLAFFLIPAVLARPVFRFFGSAEKGGRIFAFYLASFWTLNSALVTADFLFFSLRGQHLTFTDAKSGALSEAVTTAWERLGATTLGMNLAILLCLWLIGLRQTTELRKPVPSVESPSRFWSGWVFQVIAVALLARGSITAHHLDWRHARVSEFRVVQELTVNSLWAWDKDPLREQP